jgi:hypothetical protein
MVAIDFQQGLDDAWSSVATFVPKLLGFLVILLVGYFVAKALQKIVAAVLERVGFDRLVERGSLKTALERSKTDASDILGVITFWTVFLIVLQLAFGVFGTNPVSDMIAGIVAYLPNLFVAVVILVIAAAVAKVVADILSATLGAVEGGTWIARGAGVAILVIGIFAALGQLQIAPAIVNGLFYAMLAVIVGSAIVAVGGGGITTMQRYWDRTAAGLESKTREVKERADPDAAARVVDLRMEEERARMQGVTTGVPPMPEDV